MRITGHKYITKPEQYARAHVGVPIVFSNAYFDQVHADDLAAALHDLFQQVKYLFRLKPAGHGGTGIRAKFGIEPIDIEAKVYFLRQLADDVFSDLLPGLALVLALGEVFGKISSHPVLVGCQKFPFAFAVVADADLHKPVTCGTSCSVLYMMLAWLYLNPSYEAPEVAMRIYLQDAKFTMLFRDGLEISQRGAVVAAEQQHQLIIF